MKYLFYSNAIDKHVWQRRPNPHYEFWLIAAAAVVSLILCAWKGGH